MSPTTGKSATLMQNGKVLLLGGDPCGDFAAIFDPASNRFAPAGRTMSTRFAPLVTLLADGRVLIAGGRGSEYSTSAGVSTSGWAYLTSTEIYEPTSGRFLASGNMANSHVRGTATLLADGRVLISGGMRNGGGGGASTSDAEVFDPAVGTFTTAGTMNSQRTDHTATLLANGEVLIAGGWNGHAADAADDPPWDPLFVELFDTVRGSFQVAGTMSTTRVGHTATRLPNGQVLLLGGVLAVQNIHTELHPAYAELYAPTMGTINSLSTTAPPQSKYTTTLLSSGKMLLLGGSINSIAVDSAELLDPATGIMTLTTSLSTPRVGHTATLLGDGRVLVIGGTDANGNVLSSFEYWTGP
jgi:hypothetical protein